MFVLGYGGNSVALDFTRSAGTPGGKTTERADSARRTMPATSLCCPPALAPPSSLYPECADRGASSKSSKFDVAIFDPIASGRHQRTDSLGTAVKGAAFDIKQYLRRARISRDDLEVKTKNLFLGCFPARLTFRIASKLVYGVEVSR